MKNLKLQHLTLYFTSILFFSFVLNFLWESLHGFFLYQGHIMDSDKYVKMMVYMSFMDAVTILAIYLFCACFMKDIFWFLELSYRQVIAFFIIGLVVATIAEYWAVYVTHEWHYNRNMPVLWGIGVSPLVQLSVTGSISVWLTNRISSE